MKPFAFSWLFAVSCACSAPQNQGKALQESVTDYAMSMRWGRIEQAAKHVPDAARSAFIASRRAAAAQMQVHEFDVRGVDYQPGRMQARVVVAAVWSRAADPTIHQEVLEQTWRWQDDHWTLAGSLPMERVDKSFDAKEAF
jgi:hypothetical protein